MELKDDAKLVQLVAHDLRVDLGVLVAVVGEVGVAVHDEEDDVELGVSTVSTKMNRVRNRAERGQKEKSSRAKTEGESSRARTKGEIERSEDRRRKLTTDVITNICTTIDHASPTYMRANAAGPQHFSSFALRLRRRHAEKRSSVSTGLTTSAQAISPQATSASATCSSGK